MRIRSAAFCICISVLSGRTVTAEAQDIPTNYQDVLNTLDKKGDYKDSVLKIDIPRNDLHVTVDGVPAPTAFGFGGWIAMTKGDTGHDVLMGDLVLLQEEVNPVMSALLNNGLQVTALHNHFFFEQPRIFYMHVMGHGAVGDLARRVKPGLDLIGHTPPHQPAATQTNASSGQSAPAGKLDTSRIVQIIGHPGEQSGSVYKITIGRDDIHLKEMGATINSRMGLNTWAAFTGSSADAMIAGDVAMLEDEVQPVLKALRSGGLDVVAIHQHMIDTRPTIMFLHYWGKGPAEKLATGFRSALEQLGKRREAATRANDSRNAARP